ncbi:MAG: M3 family metallopeptidase, partial [Pseudomonadales bacterium]|nr:M3 family metallopeptidase [Pseudomonadales bacterium]
MGNPLLEEHKLPPFQEIKPEHVVPAIEQLIADNQEQIAGLLANDSIPPLEKLQKLESLEDRLRHAYSPVSHLNSVVNTPELRDAWNSCRPKLSEYATSLGQNPELFKLYKSIADSGVYNDLSKSQRKAIDNALRDFRLSGIDLPAEEQARFREVGKRLSELSGQFSDNVLDATMAWTKLITDSSDLKGIPESDLALLRQMAAQRDQEGYLLTLEFPSYLPVMTHCENRELRREIYEAFVTRASDTGPYAGKFDNTDTMYELLALRKEKAGLLGYANFAELSLATKMAQSTDQVVEFLEELATRSKGAATADFEALCEFARTEYGATDIEPWDLSYYGERLKEKQYSISDEMLKPYFPAPRVISGMFEVVRRLYDINITETHEIATWHPDVTTWNVSRNGEVIARFYLDLYARQHKQGGAWMDECRVRRIREDGTLQLPVAYLTCNFSAPVGDKPALLNHDEVVTLFHEFGHG